MLRRGLLIAVCALFFGGVASARTAAGLQLEAFIRGLGTSDASVLIDRAHGVGTSEIGPRPFSFGTYTGSVLIGAMTPVASFYATQVTGLPIIEAWRSMNSSRVPFGAPSWGADGYPWLKGQSCVAKDGGPDWQLWHQKYMPSGYYYYYVHVNRAAVKGGEPRNPNDEGGYNYWYDAQTYNGKSAMAAANDYALQRAREVCASQVSVYDYYQGAYAGGSAHPEMREEFKVAAITWLAQRHDTQPVYTAPSGVSHDPVLTQAQAGESGPSTGGSTTGGTTGGTTGSTTGGGTDWSTAPVDDELKCRIIDIPCNLRKLFIPQVDWGVEWREMRDVLGQKVPFAYITWLNAAQNASAQDIGIQVCAPINYEGLSIDWCSSPAVTWWKNFGVAVAFAVLYIGYLVNVVVRIRA